ncbi:MAG: hypothetical protein CMP06_13360 [Xanthomonadales bacterium]|nr:hypothetical protein [Xanthomonadales bacterium]
MFASLDDVREATNWWVIEYNEERPHDALGDKRRLRNQVQHYPKRVLPCHPATISN